jgi:hypothetical protein
MRPFVVALIVAFGVLGTFKVAKWAIHLAVDVKEPLGGQILDDRMSSDFTVLAVLDPKGYLTNETSTSYKTPMIRPFVFPDSVIKECWSCMDNKESLSFLVPYFPGSEEESVFQSICITPDDYPTMAKNLAWFGSMVCSPRSYFEEDDLVQQCDHPNLPFAYSPQRFNCTSGESFYYTII